MNVRSNHLLRLGIFLLATVTTLGLAEITGSAGVVQDYIRRSSAPAQLMTHQFIQTSQRPVMAFFQYWQSFTTIETLRKDYSLLQAQVVQLEQLQKENLQLREQLGIQPVPSSQKLLSAPIVSFPYRLVSVGSENEVEQGSLVLVNGTLVGRLSVVEKDYSRVELLSDQEAVALIGITNLGQRGIVRGMNRELVFTEVPQNSASKTGDRVMTAGEKGIKPGIFIGTLGVEKTQVTDAVKTFVIDQVQSFDTAVLVEIQ